VVVVVVVVVGGVVVEIERTAELFVAVRLATVLPKNLTNFPNTSYAWY